MNRMRHMFALTLLAPTLIGVSAGAHARGPRDVSGQFDYYAVALSWSPSYCATRSDPEQCDSGRKLGFVLHGLWPQHEAGYPQNCSTEPLPAPVRSRYSQLFPAQKLIGHEWKKHGTCSGLDPAAYFALSARLKNQLVIPAPFQRPAAPLRSSYRALVQAFETVNPALASNGVLPFCSNGGRFLREIHACYDKDGRSRACSNGQVKRSYSSCRQESFLLQTLH